MSSSRAASALTNLNALTWLAAENRVWLMVALAAIGFVVPLLGGFRRYRPWPTPSVVIRSAAMGLAFAAGAVTVSSLLHFTDPRWLTPAQRVTTHLSAPGGLFSFAKPIVGAFNSIASVPVEFRAIEASVNVAFNCALIGLAALVVVALTSGRARRADIRRVVREEIRKSAATSAPSPAQPVR